MAFNFNWSPLIADTSRARDMLTAALNKSPKPPIIVDDIIVTELNLGQVPPELEILEIGDLAEDRFRGIFKMSYRGDAFLTLKTRVQANPMNTYLTGKPSFASPAPLAAASGLTIPLQLTLSDICLSGFVILVFSRQKGLTLVFRNDPLESLKVSSTFDSIPFVRDYLQKEIEKQLRILFVDDLPAILHRLSLRMFSPEYREMDDKAAAAATVGPDGTTELHSADDAAPIDPLASPAADPVDSLGNPLDSAQLASSLDPDSEHAETHASFSQKNLLRLATLTSSHRTLSLFTPSIRDAVFRAWASPTTGLPSPHDPTRRGSHAPSLTVASLNRMQSYTSPYPSGPSSIVSQTSVSGQSQDSHGSRPSLLSYPSVAQSNYARTHARKRKRRVVNLRKPKTGSEHGETTTIPEEAASTDGGTVADSLSIPDSNLYVSSDPGPMVVPPLHVPAREEKAPESPSKGKAVEDVDSSMVETIKPSRPTEKHRTQPPIMQFASRHPATASAAAAARREKSPAPVTPHTPFPSFSSSFTPVPSYSNLATLSSRSQSPPHHQPQLTGSILEQAWMVKMAAEMAARVRDEKDGAGVSAQSFWERVADGSRFGSAGVGEAPPAYVE